LVKYADAVLYLTETCQELKGLATRDGDFEDSDRFWCRLVDYDEDGEKMILAACLYRFGEMNYVEAQAQVEAMDEEKKASLAESLLGRLGKFDVPLRELEYSTYTFDLVMDQGAYAEFKRHRMMTQTPQKLTTRLGYATPGLITEAGFESQYESAMKAAAEMYEKLHQENSNVAQYVVPNGFNRRVLAQFNLREAYAFCQLRSAANAHFSIRRVAQRIHEEIARVHPLLTKYMKLHEETWKSVEEGYFTKV
jgi:hypothetical protein